MVSFGLYNLIINLVKIVVDYIYRHKDSWMLRCINTKTKQFVEGQHNLFETLYHNIHKKDSSHNSQWIWVHASSLGEYGIARPIMKEMRERYGYKIILSFFSPTGYNNLINKASEESFADVITFLPLDTKSNVDKYLKIANPIFAIFVKSEIWINYLYESKKFNLPVYLVSALIRQDSIYGKYYGGVLRKALLQFSFIFTQDENSAKVLNRWGYKEVTAVGDSLYDNALNIATSNYKNHIVEKFCNSADNEIFIAGSIHIKKDLEMVAYLANRHRNIKFIIAPHEISEEILNKIMYELQGCVKLYSECENKVDFAKVQVLIIDYIGDLAKIYRYCKWAYVGGGFTPLLHSVIEPSVYGIPVAFGPYTKRKNAPQKMVELNIGKIVKNKYELTAWFESLQDNDCEMSNIKKAAIKFTHESVGSTEKIINTIMTDIQKHNNSNQYKKSKY